MFARFTPRHLFFLALVLGGSFIAGCGDKPPAVDKGTKLSPLEAHARAWSDSLVSKMSLAEKVGQLLMVRAPASMDSLAQAHFADSLARWGIGGVVMAAGDRDSLQQAVPRWKAKVKLPLWLALDAGTAWTEARQWPSLLGVGTTASDSLAKEWGAALAGECRFLGAQICMVSAAKVGQKGAWMRDALGASPLLVNKLSDSLVAGLEAKGIVACIRPAYGPGDFVLPTDSLPELKDNLPTLANWSFWPLRQLVAHHKGLWIQGSNLQLPEIAPLPIARSGAISKGILRRTLQFEGLLLSPDCGEFKQGGELQCLEAGTDLLVAPKNVEATISAIMTKVENGEWDETEINEKVRRLLYAKAMLGLDRLQPQHAGLDPSRKFLQLDRLIGKSTLVVLRDKKNRLPLGAGATSAKIATLAIGTSRKTDMQVAMDAYCTLDHFLLGAHPSAAALEEMLTRFKKYDYVVVALHAPLVADSANKRLPKSVVDFVKTLDKSNRLVVADFAGQASLDDLDSLSCLTFISEDHDGNAQLAGQAIMGAFPVTALLPDDISPAFPAGTGKVLKQKLRFEYSVPEELGINPNALLRIDTLLENAIKRGVFPGCQVFAAKDGKVFLHKAYGYHDYERSLRVRNTDLYDIASVSKIAATTLMTMRAYERDTLKLEQPLKYFMQDLDSSFITIKDITPAQLLIHAAGLPDGISLKKYYDVRYKPDSIRSKFYSTQRDSAHTIRIAEDFYLNPIYRDSLWDAVRRIRVAPPGEYNYSDLSMYIMKELLERILQAPIDSFVDSSFYKPMGLRRIGYNPLSRFEREEVVPTENDQHWRKQVLRGDVHDPTVAFLGGIGGPAGIFSNSSDLATIMQMLLDGGKYGGRQYFDPATVALFTSRQPGSHRGLGFDMQLPTPSTERGYCCYSADCNTFGHFGFTGTCAWADPRNKIVYVFLSNRVYPSAENTKINAYRVRQGVQQLIYDALGLGIPKEDGIMVEEVDCY